MNRIDLEYPEIEIHGLIDDVRRDVDRLAEIELAHRNEAFNVLADIDDQALVHQSHDFALELGPDRISLPYTEPRILSRLLQSERDALGLGADVQNDDVDRVTL